MKSNLLTVETSCNCCGSSSSTLVTTGTDYEYGTTDDKFSFVRCLTCGLVYLNPRPDVSELPVIYPPQYLFYRIEDIYDDRQRRSLYFKLRYASFDSSLSRLLKRLFPDQRRLVMLDIGCADGHILNRFKTVKDYEIETHGVDICREALAVASASGHKTYAGRFEDAELPESYFDFIYANNIIEHVPDPKEFARKAQALLKPGGIFLVWTPNVGSLDAKLFKKRWWGGYHFPRHFVLYDTKSIRRLATETNFEFLEMRYTVIPQTWMLTFHNLCKDNRFLNKYADVLFSTTDLIKTTPLNFLRNSCFLLLDVIVLIFTGQTANMGAVLKKPQGAAGRPVSNDLGRESGQELS